MMVLVALAVALLAILLVIMASEVVIICGYGGYNVDKESWCINEEKYYETFKGIISVSNRKTMN